MRADRRGMLLWGVPLVVVGLGAVGVAPAVARPGPMTSGWWWAGRPSQTFPVKLAPVPAVPDGGLYVASAPSGATGVSALQVELDSDAADAVLTLVVDKATGTPLVDACPAATSWRAEQGGSWDQRPQADCRSGRVSGVSPDGGATLVFQLDPLVKGTALNIVLTPSLTSGSEVAPTFGAAFRALGSDALVVRHVSHPVADLQPPPALSGTADVTDPMTPALDPLPAIAPPSVGPGQAASPSPTGVVPRAERTLVVAVDVAEGFRYSVVLLFPLILMTGGGYLGWALTRPVTVPHRVVRTRTRRVV